MSVRRFASGELEVEIAFEPDGLQGRGAITIAMPGVTWRMTLEDAESVGEKLIEIVRMAEERTPPRKT